MRVFEPETEDDVAAAVTEAARDALALSVEGHGTKRRLGRPVDTGGVLKLNWLSGVTMYEPEELVFSASAGTPLAEIEAMLAEKQQRLGFEPADWGPLWDAPAKHATLGGTVAAAVSGPRRFAAGGARDHVLGFRAVNGRGEIFKAGGRVVKNVTGYDLPKLAAGSFGTLFVMTEITMRVLPMAQTQATLFAPFDDAREGLALLRSVAKSAHEPTGLAYLPRAVRARVRDLPGEGGVALIRIEGLAEGVSGRATRLRQDYPALATAERDASAAVWVQVRDPWTLLSPKTVVWRVSVPATAAAGLIDTLGSRAWYADWGGGLLWLSFEEGVAPRMADVHAAALAAGGHATLMRASDEARIGDVFPPRDEATLALTKRIKAAFDPARVLNPGRMYAGV